MTPSTALPGKKLLAHLAAVRDTLQQLRSHGEARDKRIAQIESELTQMIASRKAGKKSEQESAKKPIQATSLMHEKSPLSPTAKDLILHQRGNMILCETQETSGCIRTFRLYDAAFRQIMGNPYHTFIASDIRRSYKWKHGNLHITLDYSSIGNSVLEFKSRALRPFE